MVLSPARDPLKSYGFRSCARDPQESGSYKVTMMFPKVSKSYGFGSGQALVKLWARDDPPKSYGLRRTNCIKSYGLCAEKLWS